MKHFPYEVCPPHPDLYQKIVKSRDLAFKGSTLPAQSSEELIDAQTLSLILGRPAKSRAHTFQPVSAEGAAVSGTRRLIVLLVDFSDKPHTKNQSHYNDLFFGIGKNSVRDYYREVSHGKLDITGEVSKWYRAPQPKTYYTDGNYGFNSAPKNAQGLVSDVVNLANPDINFSQYDNDGDQYVDGLIIIAAGSGAEQTGNKNDIWSHAWSISTKTVDNVKVSGYFMSAEDGRVGVMSHELGHSLMGWPDLYDTDYSSSGTGRWDLMAGGSWNNNGDTPAHPTSYLKYKAGWISPADYFNSAASITIQPYNTTGQTLKLPVGSQNSREYFLLSNRVKSGYDNYIPGSGLIIEHVDENKSNNTDESHYLVDIEQCDGRRDLNLNANGGDSTDPFPQSGKTSFSSDTTPNSKSYNGASSDISVTNIAKSGNNITADVKYGQAKIWTTVSLTSIFVSPHSMNAWAYVNTIGWRKIEPLTTDGVSNTFAILSEAMANNKKVNIYLDNSLIYQAYLV